METNEIISTSAVNLEIRESLIEIKMSLENLLKDSKKELHAKNLEIKILREELDNLQHLTDGNRQLINKLLTDISKLQNDVDWYKKTYVQRSFMGTILEKLFIIIEKDIGSPSLLNV